MQKHHIACHVNDKRRISKDTPSRATHTPLRIRFDISKGQKLLVFCSIEYSSINAIIQ